MPEFNLIKDSGLKEKTISVWIEAIKEGGWTVDDLLQMPFTLLIEETSVNIIEHTRAVTLSSLEIAEVMVEEYKGKVSLNRDYLLSGALLHDVGKLFEYKIERGIFLKKPGRGASPPSHLRSRLCFPARASQRSGPHHRGSFQGGRWCQEDSGSRDRQSCGLRQFRGT